jgi:hypothetical protein
MYVHSPKDVLKNPRSMCAVNTIHVLMGKYTEEESVIEFIDAFQQVSKNYYNLKKIIINTPGIIYDGDMMFRLLNTSTTANELEIDMFAFHSPLDTNMWIPCDDGMSLRQFSATFTDGLAYPNSATQLFSGIHVHSSLKSFEIWNNSPHRPTVVLPWWLRKKNKFTHGVRIVYK